MLSDIPHGVPIFVEIDATDWGERVREMGNESMFHFISSRMKMLRFFNICHGRDLRGQSRYRERFDTKFNPTFHR